MTAKICVNANCKALLRQIRLFKLETREIHYVLSQLRENGVEKILNHCMMNLIQILTTATIYIGTYKNKY